MGDSHSCFVSSNASMVCFGRNNYGQVHVPVFVCVPYGLVICFVSSLH